MCKVRKEPQQLRAAVVVVSREDSRRLDRFVLRVGKKNAARMLGLGESTVVAGCDQGRMLAATRDRLFAALEREESSAS